MGLAAFETGENVTPRACSLGVNLEDSDPFKIAFEYPWLFMR